MQTDTKYYANNQNNPTFCLSVKYIYLKNSFYEKAHSKNDRVAGICISCPIELFN